MFDNSRVEYISHAINVKDEFSRLISIPTELKWTFQRKNVNGIIERETRERKITFLLFKN